MEFNKETFLWELMTPVEIEQLIIPDEIFLLSDFMKSATSFTGTATELAESLKLECSPAVLKKKIIKHMAYLNQNNIRYSENRTFDRREFSLCYDSNDDMTVESRPQNLPSLPSALSGMDNPPSVTPCLPLCGLLQDEV